VYEAKDLKTNKFYAAKVPKKDEKNN